MSSDLNARQRAILTQIRAEGRVLVEALSARFGTTPQTIRRDLQVLSDTGEVMRFHGGASLLPGVEYIGFDIRRSMAATEKEAIARAVASRIPNNTVIMINGGTTTAAVARSLRAHTGLKVIADNISIANELRTLPGIEVLVPGGMVRRSDGALLGEETIDYIRRFRADFALIGVAAVDEDGALMDFELAQSNVARAIIASSKHVILAVDGTKFGRSAPMVVGELAGIHTLVTDHCPSARIRELCDTHDVELVETRA